MVDHKRYVEDPCDPVPSLEMFKWCVNLAFRDTV